MRVFLKFFHLQSVSLKKIIEDTGFFQTHVPITGVSPG